MPWLREQETALANALRQPLVATKRYGNTQTRSHNAQNEITGISGATTPTYDANGNLTQDETGRQFVYDAWNRLVAVKDAAGATLKSYAYDGLHLRVQETASGTTTDLYYSDAWQVLEERVASGGTLVPRAQYVWSPVYAMQTQRLTSSARRYLLESRLLPHSRPLDQFGSARLRSGRRQPLPGAGQLPAKPARPERA